MFEYSSNREQCSCKLYLGFQNKVSCTFLWPLSFTFDLLKSQSSRFIDHFARCKQNWPRSPSCFSFLTLHKSWDKIQPTEYIKLNKKVKQTYLRCFIYMWNKENSYKLKQEVFLDQCCLHLAKWSISATVPISIGVQCLVEPCNCVNNSS